MKKYKSAFLFLAACAVTAGMIALVNGNLPRILPDYKNEPRQYPHTITAEVSTVPSEQNEVDFTKPYKVSQICEFYYDQGIWDKVNESAEDTMRRSEDEIPTEAVKIMKANQFQTTVYSSMRKKINGRRYFNVSYEIQKSNSIFFCSLVYSEDKTEIYFTNDALGNSEYSANAISGIIKNNIILSCKKLISASGSELLSNFEPDTVWVDSDFINYYSNNGQLLRSNRYLLRDNTNKIIVEYFPDKNEILSFSVGK